MAVKEVLLLGNPQLYQVSTAVHGEELDDVRKIVADLHDTLLDFRHRYGAGRAIAAPQIGAMKRLLYMHIDKPIVFINPALDMMSREMIEVWDDCMCFPDLLVRVKRHQSCRISYHNGIRKTQAPLMNHLSMPVCSNGHARVHILEYPP